MFRSVVVHCHQQPIQYSNSKFEHHLAMLIFFLESWIYWKINEHAIYFDLMSSIYHSHQIKRENPHDLSLIVLFIDIEINGGACEFWLQNGFSLPSFQRNDVFFFMESFFGICGVEQIFISKQFTLIKSNRNVTTGSRIFSSNTPKTILQGVPLVFVFHPI